MTMTAQEAFYATSTSIYGTAFADAGLVLPDVSATVYPTETVLAVASSPSPTRGASIADQLAQGTFRPVDNISNPQAVATETATGLPSVSRMVRYELTFAYSYYYPPLLGVNCGNVLSDGTCEDVTASGQPWSQWLGKGVAIPFQYWPDSCALYRTPCIPPGTILHVTFPPELVGDWVVIDKCGACIANGLVYVDFLDNLQRADWSSPVQVWFEIEE